MARRWSAPCAARIGSAYWRDRRRRCSRRRCSPASTSRSRSGVGPEPTETVTRIAARPVFAADEPGIAKVVQDIEQERIVQFFAGWLLARRDAGDLDMADDRHHLVQAHGDVAMQNLAVINIELQFQVRDLQIENKIAREAKIVEEIARNVARVDRL